MAGSMMEPIAATSALLEPEMPENTAIATTITTLSPPRTRPHTRSRKAMRRVDMPFTLITSPASTKNGMESSTKLPTPACICWENCTRGSMPVSAM